MPYYGESAYGGPGGSGYYSSGSSAGGGFANHSSLMSGVNRYFNPIAARYSPHLSTISETPSLLHLRRHHAQPTSTTLSALRPCRRIIDTADIDVSKPPRSLGSSQENHSRQQRHRLRRDRPTIKIRSQALKDNPALREYNEKHEKTVGELLVEKFLIKDKGAERKMRLYHQASLVRPTADDNSDVLSKEKEDEILAAIARRVTRRMTRRRSSADIVPLDPEQIKREAALQAAQAEVLDTLVAEEQAEIECEVRRGTFAKRPVMRLPQEISEVSESEDDGDVTETEKKVHAITKKKKRRRSLDKPPPSQASDEEDEEDGSDDIHDISESIIEEEEEEDFEWDDRKKCDDIRKVLPAEVDNKDDRTRTDKSEVGNHANVSDSSFIKKQLDDKLRTVNSEIIILNKKEEPPVKSEIEQRLDQMNAKIKNLKKEVRETDRRENDKIIRKKTDTTDTLKTKDDDAVRGERTSKTLKRTKSAPQPPLDVTPGFKIEACNSVGDFSTLFIKAAGATSPSKVTEQFRESVRLPAPRASPPTEVVVLPVRKPYVRDTSRNSVYLALKPSQNIRTTVVTDDDTRKEDRTTTTSTTTITTATAAAATATLDESRPAKCDVIDRSIIENDDLSVGSVSRRSALGGGDEFVSWWDETPEEETPKSGEVVCNSVVQQEPVVKQKLDKTIPTGNFKDKVKVAKSKVDAKTTADDKTKVPDTKIKSKVIVNGFKEDKDKIDDLAVSDKTELESSPKSKPLVNDLKEVKKASTVDDKLTTKVEAVPPKIAKKTNDLQDKPKVTVKESKDKEVKDKVDLTPNVVLEKDTKKNDLPQDKPKLLEGVPKEDKVEVCVKKSLEKGTASKDKSTVLSEISKEDKVKIEVLPEKKKPAVAPKPQVNKETCEVQSKAKPAPVDVSKDNKVETTLVSEKAESKIKLPEKEKSTENKVLDKVKVTGEVVPDKPKQAAVDTVDKNFKSVIVEIKDKPAEKLSETKINKVFEKPSEKFVTKTVDKKVPELEVKEKIISNKTTDIKEKVPENKLKETKEKALVKPVEIKDNKLTDDKVIAKTAVDAKDKISAKVNEVKDKVSEKVFPKPAESKVTSNKVIEIKDKVVPEAKVPVAEPKLKAPKEPRPISPNKKAKLAPSEELREKSVSPTNDNKRKKSHNDLIIAEVPAVRPDRRHLPRIPEEQQAGVKPVATDDKSAAEPSLAAAPKKDKEDKKRKVDSEAVMMIEKKILEDAESPDMILTTALPQQETVANMKSAAVAAPEVTEIDFWSEIGLVPGAEKVQLRVDTEEDRKSLKLDFTQAPSAAPEEEEDEEKTPLISQPATPLVENLNEVPPANLKERSASVADELQQDERSATVKKITKWGNHDNLANIADTDADVTPLASKDVSPTASAASSTVTKKKIVKKKKSTTGKKSSEKGESTKSTTKKTTTKKKKASADSPQTSQLKTPMSAFGSPRNSPAQRPPELNKLFYTTPAILLTATPRDLRKVRRAKAKRKKPPTRTPSLSSDSTGSTRSTATTTSTEEGSNCEEDADHKRLASTRSNDSGFDGSPRLSNCDMVCHKKCEKLTGNLCGLNQKLVAEALQALKQKERERDKAPSQSSENQRNADSDHFHNSGRITPPATNLPRFKKYEVTDFNFLKVLGKGSFGKVLLAELRGTDCVYAVKCLKKDVVLEDDDVECTLIERKVLTLATRHPYLCHLFCTFQTESHLFFVMEYLNGGDLMFHIQKSGRFSEARAKFYAAEIWSGLIFLHKKGIVYRDLKLDNVLLDFEGHIRIADFGMCKLQIFLDRTADTFCGTPDYMAPEIIKGLKYNQAVDWWSFGVLLYEMLTGQSPFSGCDEDELFWSICNERPFIPRYLSQSSTDILVCLLEKDAGKRIPGHEIACHPFFCTIAWDKLERRVLEAPFKPAVEHTLDTRYFDTAFTTERPRLTPVPEQILTSMDQAVFRGFSYTNPNATD